LPASLGLPGHNNMNKSLRIKLFIIVLAVIVGCFIYQLWSVFAKVSTSAEILNYGIYTGTNVLTITDTNSPTSRVRFELLKVATQTNVIPAKINTKFGMQFVVHGNPFAESINLRGVYSFPEMSNSVNAKSYSRYEGLVRVKLEDRSAGMYWDFVDPWELVPGNWKFQLFDKDKLLIEKQFKVVKE
jgi:hypothetical protein